jgi:hypothetical protein
MLFGLRKVSLVCFLVLLFTLFSVSQVSAQETGTLIVYAESQGGDATFSYTGSSSLGPFQIASEVNGGAKVFDLAAGTYTVTQDSLPTGWGVQEVFCDGTGTYSTDVSQSKATFTVSSADVIYLRYTNQKTTTNPTSSPAPSPSIPENIGLPLIIVLIVIVSSFVVLFANNKKQVIPVFAVLLSALMAFAFVGPVQANPDKYIELGTSGNDEQIQFGTPNKDVIVQLGFGGVDTQYAEGSAGDDIIIQNGGSGVDTQTAISGDGDDHVVQEGGDGNDIMFADGGTGYVIFVQNGGNGDDTMEFHGGMGGGVIDVSGGEGDDIIEVVGTSGVDSITVDGDAKDDAMLYDLTSGKDSGNIDGGLGNDFLTIRKNQQSLQMLDSSGTVLYSAGSGGSVITVLNVEHGEVIGDDGKVAFQW